ncbi:MAG TPA: hypothetical protein ENK57_22265, partial [Polyangiaceae bacterium]|nr:hypothetical protein [Polyangiaceae bacterium]
MKGVATAQLDESLTVVGETDGALVRALQRRGVKAMTARLHELGRAASTLVLLGNAAVDGGRNALASAPKGARAIVVLPKGAAAARIAACAIGARVVESADLEPLADAVVSSREADPSHELGWTDLGSLLDALGDRVAQKLGSDSANSRGLRLHVGDADELARLFDRFADALAPLCQGTDRPGPDGPGIAVAELTWDDDPQTLQQEDAEVARWRRLSARGVRSKMIRGLEKDREVSGEWGNPNDEPPQGDHLLDASATPVLSRSAADQLRSAASSSFGLPGADRGGSASSDLPSGVLPEMNSEHLDDALDSDEQELDTATNAAPLPLLFRQDPDISETAPREAIRPEMLPDLALPELPGDAFSEDDSLEMTAPQSLAGVAPLPPAVAGPAAEGRLNSSPPSTPPAPAVPTPSSAPSVVAVAPSQVIEAPARRSKLPLIFGLGLVTLSAIAAVGVVGLSARSGTPRSTRASGGSASGSAAAVPETSAAVARAADAPSPSTPEPTAEHGTTGLGDEPTPTAPTPTAPTPTAPTPTAPTPTAPTPTAPTPSDSAPATEQAAAPTLDPTAAFVAARARSDEFVAVGREAARAQDWDAARRSFEVALEIHEPNPHAHAELARERMRAGDGAA